RPPATIHPTATFLLTWLYRVAVERRPATAAISSDERLTSLILLLSDLVEAAERCALEAAERCALEMATGYKPDWGGKRRAGPTAEVELMQSLMESYAALRNSLPSSGPQPAFDRALKQFVRSCLRLVDPRLASRITDAAIRGAFSRSRPNQRGNRV